LKPKSYRIPFILLALGLILALGNNLRVQAASATPPADPEAQARAEFYARMEADILAGMSDPDNPSIPLAFTPCVSGFAGPYPCDNVDLMAFMPGSTIGGGSGNDVWGWTDPNDGTEYALMGLSSGTAFIDISNPSSPVYIGKLPGHNGSSSTWRSIKVYNDYAFIVSEAGGHGMQVFDLSRITNVLVPPVTFSEDVHYNQFGNAHTIAINEDTGYAIAAGSNTCSGGLHIVNIQNPEVPVFAGCFSADGYTHEAQCVLYTGPDVQHQGKDICFAYNENTVTIVDITNHALPVQLSETPYSGSGYTHQGWLTPDQKYVLVDDELDESNFGHNTRTRIFDVSDLDATGSFNPEFYDGPYGAIDHNLYIHNGFVYESNYTIGLRILDGADIPNGNLSEVAFFDMYTPSNSTSFNGTWSNYPFFESGIVLISGINEGLFIVKPVITPDYTLGADSVTLNVCAGNTAGTTITVGAGNGYTGTVSLSTAGLPAGAVSLFTPSSVAAPGTSALSVSVDVSVAPGSYPFTVEGDDGSIQHDTAMTLNVLNCNYFPIITNGP